MPSRGGLAPAAAMVVCAGCALVAGIDEIAYQPAGDASDAAAEGDAPGEPHPCPADKTDCGATCVDTSQDTDHCGSCDRSCAVAAPSTAVCTSGTCVATLATLTAHRLAIDTANVYFTDAMASVRSVPIGGGPTAMAGAALPRGQRRRAVATERDLPHGRRPGSGCSSSNRCRSVQQSAPECTTSDFP